MDKHMRRIWWALVILLIFITQFRTLHTIWLKDLAMLQVRSAWMEQRSQVINPPCEKKSDLTKIKQYLIFSISNETSDPNTLINFGRVLWLEGNCIGAIALWEQSSLLNNNLSSSFELFRLGIYNTLQPNTRVLLSDIAYDVALRSNKDGEKSLKDQWYDRSFDLYPRHETGIYLVELYRERGDISAIQQLWKRMTVLLPDTNPDYWWAEAELLSLQEKWEYAALAFLKGAGLSPNPYDFFMRSGEAWEKIEKWDFAIEVYGLALLYQPKIIDPYLHIARVFRSQERYQDALKWYVLAKDLFPNSFVTNYYLGEFYFSHGDYKQAQLYLELTLALKPDIPECMYYLAQIKHKQGAENHAEAWMIEAIAYKINSTTKASWWIQLGDWRLESGNCSGAYDAYDAALKTGADVGTIQQKIDLIKTTCVN